MQTGMCLPSCQLVPLAGLGSVVTCLGSVWIGSVLKLLDLKGTCLEVIFHVPGNHILTVSFFVYAPFLPSNSVLPVNGKACLGPQAYTR